MTDITNDIVYEMTQGSDVRQRPIFNFEFPQEIYVILE